MGRKPLNEDEVRARFEYAKTHQPEEFAREFGLSIGTANVYYSKSRIKKARKPLFLDDEESLKFIESHTIQESAENFGRPYGRMRDNLKKYGIKPSSPWKAKVADRDEMIEYLSKEFTLESIATVFNMSRQRVSQICKREECIEKEQDTD